jgi:hypothetical protein
MVKVASVAVYYLDSQQVTIHIRFIRNSFGIHRHQFEWGTRG